MLKHIKIAGAILCGILMLINVGCGKKPPEPKPAEQSAFAVIDMQKAVQAHRKYAAYQDLLRQYKTLAQEADMEKEEELQMGTQAAIDPLYLQEIEKALQEEFVAKVTAKEKEINERLNKKAQTISAELDAEFNKYARQLDDEYQSQIFNLNLKMRTLNLTKEERVAFQEKIDALDKEYHAKMSDKERELIKKIDKMMETDKVAAEKEIADYATSVNRELSERSMQAMVPPKVDIPRKEEGARSEKAQKAAMKKLECTAMEESIIGDIKSKVEKIAAQRNLQAVFGNVLVNVQAIDITDAVIAELRR